MSKRNFILLIIILVIIVVFIFGFLYFRNLPPPPDGEEGGTNFFSRFNPFGDSSPTPPSVTPPSDTPPFFEPTNDEEAKLIRVSSMPVAGFTVFQKERYKEVPMIPPTMTETETPETTTPPTPPETEFVPALRYVAKENGNIYQTFADKIEERRITTTMVPRVHEAYFGNNGESVLMRLLKMDDKTISTLAGTLPKDHLGGDTSENNEIVGVFFPDNISDVSISRDKSQLFYLINIEGNAVGITSGILGDRRVQVFDSPFTEWLSWWPNASIITLTTKPSYAVPGYMYAVNPNRKDFNKILGEINGLTTLTSPNGNLVLYGNSGLSLRIFDISTGNSSPITLTGMPEKCVWNEASTVVFCAVPKFTQPSLYPDSWYQGEVSFSDNIWRLDTQTGTTNMLADPLLIAREEIDGIKLSLDEEEGSLFFVNKKDSYLWKLKLD